LSDTMRMELEGTGVYVSIIEPHALRSPKPKIRYRVTIPTHLFFWLKKVLPDGAMEALLKKVE